MLALYLSVIESETKRTAFEEMYIRNKERIHRAANRYCDGDALDCEDVLQETWMFVASRMPYLHFPNGKAETAYLLTVLRHRCYGYQRKKKRDQSYLTFLSQIDKVELPSDRKTPEDTLYEAEKTKQIRSLLQEMKPMDRDILMLRFYAALSIEEIARTLEISEGAVNTRLSRAKTRLAQKLEKAGIVYE